MSWWEILIIIAAASFVVGYIVYAVVRRKQGKGGCDCNCSGCPSCSACRREQDQNGTHNNLHKS